MVLETECQNRKMTVEVTESGGARSVTVNGTEVAYDWIRLPNGHYSLILDAAVYDFIIDYREGKCTLVGRDGVHIVRVDDARRLTRSRDVEVGQAGPQRITADMPGKVVRVLVKVGDKVAYDQGLLVLEAMKMQNEIRSPKSGSIRRIDVSAGTTVGTGDALLTIE